MKKELDKTITTLGNFRTATENLSDDIQIYVDAEIESIIALIEITEIMAILPKKDNEKPYIVLRAR